MQGKRMQSRWCVWSVALGLTVALVGCEKKQAAKADQTPADMQPARPGPRRAAKDAARPRGVAQALGKAQALAKAEALFGQLAKKQYDQAFATFSAPVKAGMPVARLKALWEQLEAQLGAYQSLKLHDTTTKDDMRALALDATFDKGPLRFVVSYNPAGEVVGLFIKPEKPKFPPWQPPDYAKADQVREIPVTIGEGALALPGVLTVPTARGGKKFPAVVLVHGSGPQDRDETIGPNKPFKDLAWGLAAQGIAVLRFDKVTKAHPTESAALLAKGGFTVDDETTHDALKAVALLRKNPLVQPGRVFYLGHSQGAMMAPRAGARDPKLAGLILMGGPTRKLEDLGLDQLRYIASAGGPQADATKKMLPAFEKAVRAVKDAKLSLKTPSASLPFGIPASFWLDLRSYDPGKVAAGLKMPVLILQGEADYQVTMKDFVGWKKALKQKKNAVLKSYPHLGHTFIDLGKAKAMPMDYFQITGHVKKTVIDDIARFVRTAK